MIMTLVRLAAIVSAASGRVSGSNALETLGAFTLNIITRRRIVRRRGKLHEMGVKRVQVPTAAAAPHRVPRLRFN